MKGITEKHAHDTISLERIKNYTTVSKQKTAEHFHEREIKIKSHPRGSTELSVFSYCKQKNSIENKNNTHIMNIKVLTVITRKFYC